MIVKETTTQRDIENKLISLLKDIKLRGIYGFWFESKSRYCRWDRIAIWKLTAGNPLDNPYGGEDIVVANINLLKNNVVEIIFHYRDVYNYLKPCFKNSKTKFNLVESNDATTVSPKPDSCFIATEIYGDINAPEVKTLRKFRDNSLSKNYLGRKFIDFYYSGFGKRTAHLIEKRPFIKNVIRKGLNFMVFKIMKGS